MKMRRRSRSFHEIRSARQHLLERLALDRVGVAGVVVGEQEPGHREPVGGRVDREHRRDAEQADEQGADRGADHAGEIHLHRLQRHRAREVLTGHEGRQDRAHGRRVQGVRDADREHAQEDPRLVRMVDRDESGEPERQQHLQRLHRDQEAAAVHLVGDDAADLAQEQQRAELREVEDPHVARVADLERERAEQHVLHPRPDVRQERAAPDEAEVAVAERGTRGAASQGAVAVDDRLGGVVGIGVVLAAEEHRRRPYGTVPGRCPEMRAGGRRRVTEITTGPETGSGDCGRAVDDGTAARVTGLRRSSPGWRR